MRLQILKAFDRSHGLLNTPAIRITTSRRRNLYVKTRGVVRRYGTSIGARNGIFSRMLRAKSRCCRNHLVSCTTETILGHLGSKHTVQQCTPSALVPVSPGPSHRMAPPGNHFTSERFSRQLISVESTCTQVHLGRCILYCTAWEPCLSPNSVVCRTTTRT